MLLCLLYKKVIYSIFYFTFDISFYICACRKKKRVKNKWIQLYYQCKLCVCVYVLELRIIHERFKCDVYYLKLCVYIKCIYSGSRIKFYSVRARSWYWKHLFGKSIKLYVYSFERFPWCFYTWSFKWNILVKSRIFISFCLLNDLLFLCTIYFAYF